MMKNHETSSSLVATNDLCGMLSPVVHLAYFLIFLPLLNDGGYVLVVVCVFVCLCAKYHKVMSALW